MNNLRVSGADSDALRRHKPRLGWMDSAWQQACGGSLHRLTATEPGMSGRLQCRPSRKRDRIRPHVATEAKRVQFPPHPSLSEPERQV